MVSSYSRILIDTIGLSDYCGVNGPFNESITISDNIAIIIPVVELPPEAKHALKNHPTQKLWQLLQNASIEIQKIRTVTENDYVLAEDVNRPKKAIEALLDVVGEIESYDPCSDDMGVFNSLFDAYISLAFVPKVMAGDIYSADIHNALVSTIKKLVRLVRKWLPLRLGPEATTNLVERSDDELIIPEDHNAKKRALTNVYRAVSYLSGIIVVVME